MPPANTTVAVTIDGQLFRLDAKSHPAMQSIEWHVGRSGLVLGQVDTDDGPKMMPLWRFITDCHSPRLSCNFRDGDRTNYTQENLEIVEG